VAPRRLGVVGIDSPIGVSVITGLEAAKPEQISPLYWICTRPNATSPKSSSASEPRASRATDTPARTRVEATPNGATLRDRCACQSVKCTA